MYCPIGISALGNSGCFPQEKPAATESRYSTYGVRWVFLCFHNPPNSDVDCRILNMRTEFNACNCTRGCADTVRESALKVDSGRKIPCRTGESNLRQRHADPTLYQLSYPRPPTLVTKFYPLNPEAIERWKVKETYLCSLSRNQRSSTGIKMFSHTKFSHFPSTRTGLGSLRFRVALGQTDPCTHSQHFSLKTLHLRQSCIHNSDDIFHK